MGISLTEASKLVGISKNGLMKAITKGRVSAEKNESGVWMVEPTELFRVYKPVDRLVVGDTEKVGVGLYTKNEKLENENSVLKAQVELLREQLDKADMNHGKILKIMEEQISAIRFLTDQREEKKEEAGRGFWRRVLG